MKPLRTHGLRLLLIIGLQFVLFELMDALWGSERALWMVALQALVTGTVTYAVLVFFERRSMAKAKPTAAG